MKVIIVDDEIKICQLIKHLVDWDTMQMEVVDIVNDGKSAYESICRNRPDIVITDIRIPNYDGLQLIHMCKEQFPSLYFIIISGYSEFEFAKSALQYGVEDYLLKPIKKKELENALNRIREKYEQSRSSEEEKSELRSYASTARAKIQQDFLTHVIASAQEMRPQSAFDLAEVNSAYDCSFQPGQFTIAIFRLFLRDGATVKNSEDFLVAKLQEITREAVAPNCCEFLSVSSGRSVVCLINTQGDGLARVKKQFHRVKLEVTNELFSSISLAIGVGSPSTELSGTVTGYREAERSLLNRFCDSDHYIFEFSDVRDSGKAVSDLIDMKGRDNLIAAQERMDVNAILAHVRSLQERLGEYRYDSSLVCNCVLELIEILQFGSKNYDIYFQKFDVEESRRKIGNILTFDELFDWLKNEIINRYQEFANLKKVAEKKPIRVAKQYIYDNYNKNLTLEGVSNHIGFNPTYFSAFFKKETGKNFSEYLTELRMKNAKLCLISSDRDIADIAEEVGYGDIKYFSKLFKKVTGLSPSEYRKLYG